MDLFRPAVGLMAVMLAMQPSPSAAQDAPALSDGVQRPVSPDLQLRDPITPEVASPLLFTWFVTASSVAVIGPAGLSWWPAEEPDQDLTIPEIGWLAGAGGRPAAVTTAAAMVAYVVDTVGAPTPAERRRRQTIVNAFLGRADL